MSFQTLVADAEALILKLPPEDVDRLVASAVAMLRSGRELMDAPEAVADAIGKVITRGAASIVIRGKTLDDLLELAVKAAPTVGGRLVQGLEDGEAPLDT